MQDFKESQKDLHYIINIMCCERSNIMLYFNESVLVLIYDGSGSKKGRENENLTPSNSSSIFSPTSVMQQQQ